jgi:hypothetical protein
MMASPADYILSNIKHDLLYTETVGSGGASSIDTGTIDCTPYTTLELRLCARTTRDNILAGLALYFNDDTTPANYYSLGNYHGQTTGNNDSEDEFAFNTALTWTVCGALAAAGIFDMCTATVGMANSSSLRTVTLAKSSCFTGAAGSTTRRHYDHSVIWDTAAVITRVAVVPINGENFAEHTSFQVYGVK